MEYSSNFVGAEGLNYPANGKPLYQEDFAAEHDGVFDEISGREKDVISPGIVSGFECAVGSETGTVIISAGSARDSLLRRIISTIAITVSIPNGTTVRIVARHKWVLQEYTPDGAAEVKIRRIHSCEIVAIDNILPAIDGDVLLWRVTRMGSSVTIDADLRTMSKIQVQSFKDRIITLNKGESGAGVTGGYAGLEIDRGTLAKAQILLDESSDEFQAGIVGDMQKIIRKNEFEEQKSLCHGLLAITLSSSDVTLTAEQLKYEGFILSGALTANVNVIVTGTVRQYHFINICSGAFYVTIKTAAGTGITSRPKTFTHAYCDGTNILQSERIDTATKTASYDMTDSDGILYFEYDTTNGDCIHRMPLGANNVNRRVRIGHVKSGAGNPYKVIISPHSSDPNTLSSDGLPSIWLPSVGDYVEFKWSSTSGKWEIVSEKITALFEVHTYAGYGLTDIKIPRFSSVSQNLGNMFSENHSSGYSGNAKGLEIIINRSGNYAIDAPFLRAYTSAQGYEGLSLNSSQLTTDIHSITATDILDVGAASTYYGSTYSPRCTRRFKKGDIIREHTNGLAGVATIGHVRFRITYLGQ